MKKALISSAVLAALLVNISVAKATTVVASDNFNAKTGSVTAQTGGTGWASGWQSGLTPAPTVVTQSAGDNALQMSTTSVNAAYRDLSVAMTGDIFVRYTFQYSGKLETNDFLGLWFGNSDGPNIGMKANCGDGTCANDAFTRTNMGETAKMINPSDLSPLTSYVLFGHLYKSIGSTNYNRFDAWLNPSSLEMATLINPDARAAGNSSMSSVSRIGFRTFNLNGVTVQVDDIEVSAVPEPGSMALLGAALLAAGGLRRRRQ